MQPIRLLLYCAITCCFLTLPTWAYAALPPDAGSLLESLPKSDSAPPAPPLPLIDSPSSSAPKSTDSATVIVSRFQIDGERFLAADALKKLTDPLIGKSVTLADLELVADAISRQLQHQGYLVGFAYIPPQDIQNGVIDLIVLPGCYDQIRLQNSSTLQTDWLQHILHPLQHGDPIRNDLLESTLLTIAELPGIQVKSTLIPGSQQGTSDLLIEVSDGNRLNAISYFDNHLNPSTGQLQGYSGITFKNPTGNADSLSISGSTSGRGLNAFGAEYSIGVAEHGERLGVSFSRMNYALSGSFAALNASGDAAITSIWHTIPLRRSRTGHSTLRFSYEEKKMYDKQIGFASHKNSESLSLRISGADYWANGSSSYAFSFQRGRLHRSPDDFDLLETRGYYNKCTFDVSNQRYLTPRLLLLATASGQWAGKNLDSSEKLFLGGASAVRAYPEGEAGGDSGYKASIELHWLFPSLQRSAAVWSLIGFFDAGQVTFAKNPLAGSGSNTQVLTGAGIGIQYMQAPSYSLRLDYAWKLGHESELSSNDKNGRLWLRAIHYF